MARSKILGAAVHLGRRAVRRKATIVSTLFIVFFLLPILMYILLGTFLANDPRLVPHAIRNAQNVLLITAHPDDECLFFSPSILHSWGKAHVNRHVLVLSSGNYEGLGAQRRAEAKASCAELGIADDKCLILEHKHLQDNPREWWDEKLVERTLDRHVQMWNIDLIITFDEYGISGHVNHRSVSNGVRKFANDHDHNPPAYAVQTKFVLRKYSSLADLIPTSFPFTWRILQAVFTSVPKGYATTVPVPGKSVLPPEGGDRFGDRALLVTNWSQYMKGRAAFKQHASQYSWDRVLYLVLSRYMWFNDLRRM
ncbi:putative glycan biosynthesis protein [Talaromyces proteolyticus]|uniref:N-acetylglucosaminylphosphatidylinositol deacetylase n=1 Tax=Talaromyces proteolyticus TaxID=1131652 RepID=A0AAD4KMM3_9EURO|nr:putative glycan biosynthesis protein [Talaromyces proteolyticus]KAH8695107.1 putative glycan biosynthesis protein [Talaromyces proteolyticus]